jgi:ATP-dependent exoDNAse (exonuclease V) beta subunit
MDDRERIRLLYVATRARDHLVVSLHRSAKSIARTSARLLADEGGAAEDAEAWSVEQLSGDGDVLVEPTAPRAPQEYEAWLRELTRAREASRRASAFSASGLEGTDPEVAFTPAEEEAGRAKGALNIELPAWSKGRYGTAIGRAVHGVLQTVAWRRATGWRTRWHPSAWRKA